MGTCPVEVMKRNQIILFACILLAIVGVLSLLYFVFLRPNFAPLYEDIREADAAQIVAELDKQGIEYRLEDKGHRILVPESEIGKARVLIAGSGIAMGGTTGFELFNESDMGLTEFAQKVNYQRALQGELARTIMGMEGISFARVHLSMPERNLFQADRQGPKAAVTIQTEAGGDIDASRVAGIQQLVAAAVTDLPATHVAVLDDRGRLLSPVVAQESGTPSPPGILSEKNALEEYYRARATGVAEKSVPGLPFQIRVLVAELHAENEDNPTVPSDAPEEISSTAAIDNPVPSRNFQLRIFFRTEAPLNDEDRELLRGAIARATGIVPARGDILRFETGPFQAAVPLPQSVPVAANANGDHAPTSAIAKVESGANIFGILGSRWL